MGDFTLASRRTRGHRPIIGLRMGALIVLLFQAAAGQASDAPSTEERLQRLERQNAQLQEELQRIRQSTVPKAPVVKSPVVKAASVEAPQEPKPSEPEAVSEAPLFEPGNLVIAEEAVDPKAVFGTWKDGVEWSTKSGDFRLRIGGRTHFDTAWNSVDPTVEFGPGGTGAYRDGFVMRRARLRAEGAMYESFEWVTEIEFGNAVDSDPGIELTPLGSPLMTDVYMQYRKIPGLGNFRVGNFKEPISLEHLTSSRWLNFIERSLAFDAFTERFNNGFSTGLMLFDTALDDRMTWAIGLFRDSPYPFGFGIGDASYAETGRITILPVYRNEGRQLVHLGIAASHRELYRGLVRVRARPSLRSEPAAIIPALANTGVIAADEQNLIDLEFLAIMGPWTLQAEYYASQIANAVSPNSPAGTYRGDLFYQGWYAEVLYFLTGEHRPYNVKMGVPDRIRPNRNVDFKRDTCFLFKGAWQVGVRYGYLDAQDKGVQGATLHDVTFGLNWFLNPNMKIQWNYALTERDSTPAGSSGLYQGFGMRYGLDF